ncbi:hypothetical protein [Candidatus Ichthyocystis hellenicum]|uniref:hypothetical protein n=1 Tax=Candidatus Ichthyocystis hellenicum TaxID=1561003 RepID=UPI000B87FBBC|nr:hypothetical protein [Candidatus Ichthyocystis hellenicum]
MGPIDRGSSFGAAAIPDKANESGKEGAADDGSVDSMSSLVSSPQPKPRGVGGGTGMLKVVRIKQKGVTESRVVAALKDIVVSQQSEESGGAVQQAISSHAAPTPAPTPARLLRYLPVTREGSSFEGRRGAWRVKRDASKLDMEGAPDYDGSSPLEGGILKHPGGGSEETKKKREKGRVRFLGEVVVHDIPGNPKSGLMGIINPPSDKSIEEEAMDNRSRGFIKTDVLKE